MPRIHLTGIVFPGDFRQVQKAEDIQAVIDGDNNCIAATGKREAVIHGFRTSPGVPTATVKPDQDRPLALVSNGRGPDIQYQTISCSGAGTDEPFCAADGIRTGLID